jgi:hypothetical protein
MRVLIGVSVGLCGAFLVSLIPPAKPRSPIPTAPKEIQRLDLNAPQENIHILAEKNDTGWNLSAPAAFPADAGLVERFLNGLGDLKAEQLVTSRTETHGQYQVDDAQGVRVSAWGAGTTEPVTWIFGKASPELGKIYLRKPEAPEVYLVSGLDRSTLETSPMAWRDRRILPLGGLDDIVTIASVRGGVKTVLNKSSDSWTVNGATASATAVDGLLTSLREAQAEEIIDPPSALNLSAQGLHRPDEILTITLASGLTRELRFAPTKKGAATVAVKRDDAPHVYLLPAWSRNRLSQTPAALADPHAH